MIAILIISNLLICFFLYKIYKSLEKLSKTIEGEIKEIYCDLEENDPNFPLYGVDDDNDPSDWWKKLKD